MKNKFKILIAVLIITALFAGCSSSSSEKTLNLATKPMTEQFIVGSMFKELVEKNSDIKVEVTYGVGGGTSNIQPGIESGKFDIYPEYTGTGWNQVLKKESIYREDMFAELQSGYTAMELSWQGMLGFNNTFGLAVRKEIADKYNLKTYSDLAKVSDKLIFGAEYDFFEREDGYKALQDTYGINFKSTTDIDIGLKYDAIKESKIDAMNIFTTDGQLSQSDLVVLEDDKGLYPSYMCGFVVRKEILDKYPELEDIFKKLEKSISDKDMADMNYQVEILQKEPSDVGSEYLKNKGLSD